MPRHLDEVLTQTKRFYTAKTQSDRAAHFAVMHNGVSVDPLRKSFIFEGTNR